MSASVQIACPRSRIAIVDDHPLLREGLAARISAQPELEVCGEAADIEGALALVRETRPDLLILDLVLKGENALHLIKLLTADAGGPKILVVSAYEEEVFAERALRAGAQGYLNKQELQGSVIDAVRAVLRGELAIGERISQRLANQALSGPRAAQGVAALSDREMQVFELIGHGLTTRVIAERLKLSVHTVESHRENIRLKLQLRNGTELLRQAVLWTVERRG